MKLENYIPLWRQVLLSPIKETKTESGLYLSESAAEEVLAYTVIKVGKDVIEVKEGNQVAIEDALRSTSLKFEDSKDDLLQISEQQIIGIY